MAQAYRLRYACAIALFIDKKEEIKMDYNLTYEEIVVVDHIHDNGTTVVRVELIDSLGPVDDYVGTARKHPDDKNDPMLGYCIAYGRAVEKLVKDIQKRVAAEVAQADHEREHAKKVAAEKAPYRDSYDALISVKGVGVCGAANCFCNSTFDEWYANRKRYEVKYGLTPIGK
jgi:hypothetical protein